MTGGLAGRTKYRIFVEISTGRWINPTAESDVYATSPGLAILSLGAEKYYGRKLIALPSDREDLWPDRKTGVVSEETLAYCVKPEDTGGTAA